MFDIALPVDAFQGMLSHSLPLLASAPPWAGEGSFLGKMVVLFVGAIFIGSSFAIGQALAGERGGVVLG